MTPPTITIAVTQIEHAWLIGCVKHVISGIESHLNFISEDGPYADSESARNASEDLAILRELERKLTPWIEEKGAS